MTVDTYSLAANSSPAPFVMSLTGTGNVRWAHGWPGVNGHSSMAYDLAVDNQDGTLVAVS
jgi:hypothetical protein